MILCLVGSLYPGLMCHTIWFYIFLFFSTKVSQMSQNVTLVTFSPVNFPRQWEFTWMLMGNNVLVRTIETTQVVVELKLNHVFHIGYKLSSVQLTWNQGNWKSLLSASEIFMQISLNRAETTIFFVSSRVVFRWSSRTRWLYVSPTGWYSMKAWCMNPYPAPSRFWYLKD